MKILEKTGENIYDFGSGSIIKYDIKNHDL